MVDRLSTGKKVTEPLTLIEALEFVEIYSMRVRNRMEAGKYDEAMRLHEDVARVAQQAWDGFQAGADPHDVVTGEADDG